MAFLIQNGVIINDSRELIGVGTAGITTALYVGENIQLDAVSGIVTATEFIGIGSQLKDVPGLNWVSATAPTERPNGDDLQEGDVYYDTGSFRQFTYYTGDSGGWRDSNPAANSALDVQVGASTATIIPGADVLKFESSANSVSIGINTATDTLTFGLDSDVKIATSLQVGAGVSIYSGIITSANGTPVTYYGDGSNLTGVGIGADSDLITTGDIQAGVITATTSLEATAASGVGLTVTSDAFISGNITVDTDVITKRIKASGNVFEIVDEFSLPGGSRIRLEQGGGQQKVELFADNLNKVVVDAIQDKVLINVGGGSSSIFNSGGLEVGAGNSVTAPFFYGDGSKLEGINVGAAVSVTSQDSQINDDFPMPFLSDVGVGVTIFTDSTTNEEFTYNPSTGILKAKEFDALSDARLKTDIIRIEDALGKVAELRGVEYNWKNGSGASVGVIAQELQEVYPQLVSDNGERLTVNYNGLVGLLIAAVNEISAELKNLKESK